MAEENEGEWEKGGGKAPAGEAQVEAAAVPVDEGVFVGEAAGEEAEPAVAAAADVSGLG